jgi:transcriptional regulator with GAF, ATPase, and Fis domain
MIIKKTKYDQVISKLNDQTEEIRKATEFVKKIENFNLDAEYEGASGIEFANQKALAAALISMRNRMKEYSEKELERKWSTEGYALFANILRKAGSEDLYDELISRLVKYLQANQGGLFLINEEEEKAFIELKACYAYDKKKYHQKKIELREGLIGQCMFEKEPIYMTELPSNYIAITSGIGGATPRALILIPLKMGDKIYGVIELATFTEFKPYQREFIEKLSESIASAVATKKNTERTERLLQESQIKEEKLRAQEEEMRQNLEELHTTQEHMKKQEEEMIEQMQEMAVSMQEEVIKKEQYYLAQIEELKTKYNIQ